MTQKWISMDVVVFPVNTFVLITLRMSNLVSNERVISNGLMLPFIGAIIRVKLKCYTGYFLIKG